MLRTFSLADVGNDTASTGDSGLSVSDNALSPDNNASNLLASPVNGLLPELTPDAMEDGVCLFLLQVSGPSAVYGNEGLCQELSSNLATRLTYVNDSNLFLLNYTQVPSNHRRRILENAAPSSPAPAPLGAIQPGVVALPDLQAEMQNISLQGTGVKIKGPSMTFMYEVFAQDNAYIVNIHNQLNSIIATSVLLKDVQAANLSIYSIYLLDFQPEATIAGANSAFPPPSPSEFAPLLVHISLQREFAYRPVSFCLSVLALHLAELPIQQDLYAVAVNLVMHC